MLSSSLVVLLSFILHFAISTAQQTPSRGIQIIPNTCLGKDLFATENAILDASYLASAGMNAAASWRGPPFSMFFDPTRRNSHTVYGIFQRIMRAQQGSGGHIGVTCQDLFNHCNSSINSTKITPAYSVQYPSQHRMPQIIMCPAGLALPRDPEPCSENPGGISLGWLMVHVMVHLSVISGSALKINGLGNGTAREVTERVLMGKETIGNASAYAYLGDWSWACGLGGPPWNQQRQCLENLRHGNRDASLPSTFEILRWRDMEG